MLHGEEGSLGVGALLLPSFITSLPAASSPSSAEVRKTKGPEGWRAWLKRKLIPEETE